VFDAVVCLANLMDADGTLNTETAERLSTAVEIYKAGRAPFVVTCGWNYRPDSQICIADAMVHHGVQKLGVPATAFLTETTSRDTVGDAVFSKRNFFVKRHWKSVAVVTSAYHAARTKEIFSFVYGTNIDVFPAISEQSESLRLREEESLIAFRATFAGIEQGDDEAIFTRLIQRHPFYNGEIYPLITEWPDYYEQDTE
jgi:uncharacterized SAM-binding protein YcdF (DUF218 family)